MILFIFIIKNVHYVNEFRAVSDGEPERFLGMGLEKVCSPFQVARLSSGVANFYLLLFSFG